MIFSGQVTRTIMGAWSEDGFRTRTEKQTDIHSSVLHETLPDMIAEFDRRFDQNAEKS